METQLFHRIFKLEITIVQFITELLGTINYFMLATLMSIFLIFSLSL